jgi:hypothetical protein
VRHDRASARADFERAGDRIQQTGDITRGKDGGTCDREEQTPRSMIVGFEGTAMTGGASLGPKEPLRETLQRTGEFRVKHAAASASHHPPHRPAARRRA